MHSFFLPRKKLSPPSMRMGKHFSELNLSGNLDSRFTLIFIYYISRCLFIFVKCLKTIIWISMTLTLSIWNVYQKTMIKYIFYNIEVLHIEFYNIIRPSYLKTSIMAILWNFWKNERPNANIPCATADTVGGCMGDVMVQKLTKLHHHQRICWVSVVRPGRQLCTNPPSGRQFETIGGTFARQTTAAAGILRQHDPIERGAPAAKVWLPQVVAGAFVTAETVAVVAVGRGQPGTFLVDGLAGQSTQVTS